MTRAQVEQKLAGLHDGRRQLIEEIESVIEMHTRLVGNKQAFDGAIEFTTKLLAEWDPPAPVADVVDPPKE